MSLSYNIFIYIVATVEILTDQL